MNTIRRGYVIKSYIAMMILTSWLLLLACVSIAAYPAEATRFLDNNSNYAAIAHPVASDSSGQEDAPDIPMLTNNPDVNYAKWTFMVYIAADDDSLEDTAIKDFREMAGVGSNEAINIVVQLDRFPGDDISYGNWTDCRRFLVTESLTPADGNEIMNLGEMNMGDPATLVDFVKWAASNYPAEKYALVLSSHGKGWEGCCWDKTSGNDNLDLEDMQIALSDVSGFIGQPLDILGFDACLMSTTEVAYQIRQYASIMVASEQIEPLSGWPYGEILTQLAAEPDMNAVDLATTIVYKYYMDIEPRGYTMSAINLTKVSAVVESLNDLAQALLSYDGTDTQAVKNCAGTLSSALDEAVIYERHGASCPGSNGLSIYFPRYQGQLHQAYSADTVSLCSNSVWEEFVSGYYSYSNDNWINIAKSETQQYYLMANIDLYDFCQHLIDS